MLARRKGLVVLAGLLLVFILPLFLARYVYYHPELLKGQTNKGQLLNPPLQLAQLPLYTGPTKEKFDQTLLQAHWTIAYIRAASCETSCEQNLYKIQQIRTALGKDRGRVNRLLLVMNSTPITVYSQLQTQLAKEYQGTLLASTDLRQLSSFLNLTLTQAASLDSFYIIDPLGNIMLHYPADVSPDAIFKDLQRLLKISQIG